MKCTCLFLVAGELFVMFVEDIYLYIYIYIYISSVAILAQA